ncbi:cation:proton antiporter [Kineococcus gynurae]|uniref:Cation:proton antiporter n=1 Tax=Kineococcus gynurae TaxID=452979 RepID=A0ABV5LVF3_9ACTN
MELLAVGVLGLLVIAAARGLGDRTGLAAPLLLVGVGTGVSLLPFTPDVTVDPELVLTAILPPLLYSAAVSMPSMNFRREFTSISGLSVALVLLTSLVLGAFLSWVVPGLSFAWGVALGAVLSPTDAVATSIARQVGLAPRVMAMLEGESLLNDATALVLLRTATVAAAASFSLPTAVASFLWSVALASVLGWVVGRANLALRARTADPTVNTAVSFAVPFVAALPAEAFGASGLVAAVVTGIVTGHGAPRYLSPAHRLSDAQNWRTLELVLEGAVFLLMGLQLSSLLAAVHAEHAGVPTALGLAGAALGLTLLVRALFVGPLLLGLRRLSRHGRALRPRVQRIDAALRDPDRRDDVASRLRRRVRGRRGEPDLDRFGTRVRRRLADLDYFLAAPVTARDGVVLVWAGMRGAITVAAAQTLPPETPDRALLVLIAFTVAALSLLLQGGTLPAVVRAVGPSRVDPLVQAEQREAVRTMLAAVPAPEDADLEPRQRRLATVRARREVLLEARDDGLYDAEALDEALGDLDAVELTLLRRH